MTSEDFQNIVIIATLVLSAAGLVLGIFNYSISKASQRNNLREIVYKKQFEFFMKWNVETGIVEMLVNDFAHDPTRDSIKFKKAILEKSDVLDMLVAQNELIIPIELFKSMSKYISLTYKVTREVMNSKYEMNKKQVEELNELSIDLIEDISEFLGIEYHSMENSSLIRKEARERR